MVIPLHSYSFPLRKVELWGLEDKKYVILHVNTHREYSKSHLEAGGGNSIVLQNERWL